MIGICIGDPFVVPLAVLYWFPIDIIEHMMSNHRNHVEENLFGVSAACCNSVNGLQGCV